MTPLMRYSFILLLLSSCAFPTLAQGKKPLLTDAQRKEAQAIIADFRNVRGMQEQRLAAIERMQPIGPLGLKQLLEIIQKELGNQVSDYRQAFAKAAAAEGIKTLSEGNLAEIAELQAEVLDLSKQPELKKKEIVKVSDPGLARLKELIIVGREDVLRKHPELARRRDLLQPLGQQWEKCGLLLLVAQAEEDEKARREKEKKEEKEPAKAANEAKSKVKEDGEANEDDEPLDPPSFEKYLLKEEEMAAALAIPMDDQTRQTLAYNDQLAPKLDTEEARCILDLNLTRSLLGLKLVRIDLALTAAARDHSADMETLKFFSHESPVPDKKTPEERAQRFGSSYSSENIAMGIIDGTVANHMWWHSPGHHKNMLGSHGRVGVGRSGVYWTELFGD
jgi:uncharacterized protein YkwD